VPAKAIEDFVVDKIKRIGTDVEVIRETATRLKEEVTTHWASKP
jgi:hypothetical protein